MPIDISRLLQPISDESPGGADLRYHPITEKIKEARRQDEDLAQGVWKLELKAADYPLVVKLSVEALTRHGKDLQIAAWLTEALANLHGIAGFREGLDLMQALLETFWDTVYPAMDEDGDLELRAVPLSWIGSQLGPAVRSAAILPGGYNWYNYRSSRGIPTEEQAQMDPARMAARTEALEEGQVSPEEFEKAFEATPLAALKATQQDFVGFGARVEELNQFCNEKFGDQSPDFGPLRSTVEEVGGVVRVLYKKKESIEGINEPEPPVLDEQPSPLAETYVADEPVAVVPRRRVEPAAQPTGAGDAIARIAASAHYLRRENPQNPMPYLVLRSLRWGEFRALQGSPDAFPAPRTEIRVELKHLLGEGSWEALREAAEDAAAQPCGRAWIDLQRYAVLACRYSGCDQAAAAIVSAVRGLLEEFPDLPASLLADDTPAANSETARWLEEESIVKRVEPLAETVTFAPPAPAPDPWIPEPACGEDGTPDAFDLAMEAARGGRIDEAVDILTREIARGDSGRARFLRRSQLAQICLAAGQEAMSRPLLEDLSEEIVRRGLEQWEAPGMVSQPLAMLYRCLTNGANEERERLYARICKLDPPAALRLAR
jgi:type VI secretion system protein ImpA